MVQNAWKDCLQDVWNVNVIVGFVLKQLNTFGVKGL